MSRKSSPKAVRTVKRVLADGTTRTYTYRNKPARKRARGDTIGDLIAAWERSPEWAALRPRTVIYYVHGLKPLMGMQHVQASRVERRHVLDIRNAIATATGNGAATAFVRTASALFGWAIENGWLKNSPTLRMKRLKGGTLPAWTQQDADLAIKHLPEHLRRAVVLALYSGQRRGDLIRLPWSAYDGRALRLKQRKTGTVLVIPCHPFLKAELDAWRAETTSAMILVNRVGRPWEENNLSNQITAALALIDGFPAGRGIHGLRKLAATNLAECGCSLHEIGSITGHRSLAMIQLYTAAIDQERLAEAAILRWTGKAGNALKVAE